MGPWIAGEGDPYFGVGLQVEEDHTVGGSAESSASPEDPEALRAAICGWMSPWIRTGESSVGDCTTVVWCNPPGATEGQKKGSIFDLHVCKP